MNSVEGHRVMLDAQEKRTKAIDILKNKMFDLMCDYIEYSTCADEPHIKSCQEKAKKIWEELCWRYQDLEMFRWDFEEDWDLNYDDYGLET